MQRGDDQAAHRDTALRPPGRWLLAVLAVVAAGAALQALRVVLIPLCVALFLAVMLWPVQRRLVHRLGSWWAAAVMGVLLAAVTLVAAGAVTLILASARDDLAASVSRLWESLDEVRAWAERRGLPASWVPVRGEDGSGLGLSHQTVATLGSFLESGLAGTLGLLAAAALTLFLTVLALGEAPHWEARLERVIGRDRARRVSAAFHEASKDFARYMLATTASGACAGALTAALCWAVDVPMPLVWGLLSFLLNYVPNIGVLLSGIPPALLALVHGGVGPGLAFTAGLVVIEMLTGNVLAPVLTGRAMCLSPLTVMAAVMVWSWLWGAAGALLAAPMTVAMVIAMRRFEATGPVAELLIDREGSRRCGRAPPRRQAAHP